MDEGKVGIQKQLPLASIIVSQLLKELSIRVASRDTEKLTSNNPAIRYLTIISWSSVPQILVLCRVWFLPISTQEGRLEFSEKKLQKFVFGYSAVLFS